MLLHSVKTVFQLNLQECELKWLWLIHYRLCLSGEKEVHEAVIQNVKDLALVFSKYKDEVLVRMFWILQNKVFCLLDLLDQIIS